MNYSINFREIGFYPETSKLYWEINQIASSRTSNPSDWF